LSLTGARPRLEHRPGMARVDTDHRQVKSFELAPDKGDHSDAPAVK
jgi:hypothetical protein